MPLRQSSEGREESRPATPSAMHERHILQMIAHGSLDMLEDRQFLDHDMYHKHDEGIRLFLTDAWELWLKELDAPIGSRSFDVRLRASARKHL
ncbi:TRAPP subunit [Malassezia equina]|uniref:TRAPP subunit n=1 Tax=Malassezia equina TaxID=1381935 RepID=A0AAF0EGW1_9BASI|nr:TRAPP subunit [Malassezia equina]